MSDHRSRAMSAVTDDDAVDAPKPIVYGVAGALSPMVRRIVAHNPGMMTGPGTNTYLVGIDEVAVIDPGPGDAGHLDAIAGCGGDRIRWILLTHTHEDHSPGAVGLKKRTGAEILAYGPGDGRGKVRLDGTLGDGAVIEATEFHLTALHTPGHASNHLCYLLNEERTLFTGDHVMQGSTVVISPPDGDMASYLASLEKLKTIRPRLKAIAPGHGHVIDDPLGEIDAIVEHRLAREAQVLDELRARGTATIAELVEEIYTDVALELHPVARRTVWAHLRKLADEGSTKGDGIDDEWSAT
jgi:glyoxylase-like metal-dependent hydrolase (beta-lactamase superfamily II)